MSQSVEADVPAESWEKAGYPKLPRSDCALLDSTVGCEWRQWLKDVAERGTSSAHYEDLRSVMVGISVSVHAVLAGMGIRVQPEIRIGTMVRAGRPLRAAFATMLKDGSSEEKYQAAAHYIRETFGAAPEQKPDSKRFHHVYASKNAATFELTTSRDGQSALQIEAASKGLDGGYDWSRKIIIQLKESETLEMLCVLRGWSAELELANHGASRDKRMTFKRQTNAPGYLLSLRQGGEAKLVPIPPFESHKIAALAMQAVQSNNPGLNSEMIAEMAKELSSHKASVGSA